jgi:hypothetical protein
MPSRVGRAIFSFPEGAELAEVGAGRAVPAGLEVNFSTLINDIHVLKKKAGFRAGGIKPY